MYHSAQSLTYRITGRPRAECSADITRHGTVMNGGFDGPINPFRIVAPAQCVEHQRRGQNRADRVGLVTPASGGAEPCTGSNIDVRPG